MMLFPLRDTMSLGVIESDLQGVEVWPFTLMNVLRFLYR